MSQGKKHKNYFQHPTDNLCQNELKQMMQSLMNQTSIVCFATFDEF